MEIEELHKAWKELNERVSRNELVHQKQVIEMLSRQKESSLQKMKRLDKIGLFIVSIVFLFTGYEVIFRLKENVHWLPLMAFVILLYVLTSGIISFCLLKKIEKEHNLEEQIKRMLRYRSYVNWTFLISYISILPLVGGFFYYNNNQWFVMVTCILIVVCVIIDYFQYHFFSDKMKELTRINKELMEIKQEEKQ